MDRASSGGVNVADRDDDWKSDYRCPDVVVYLAGTAVNHGTHWVGGPDFGVEIVSPQDRSREKLDFYARVGVRELLVIDRTPWAMELYCLEPGGLRSTGRLSPGGQVLTSKVLPLTFGWTAGPERPAIEVTHRDKGRRWAL